MKQNVGGLDRVVRIVVAIALIGWGVAEKNWIGAVGLVPLVTAALGWCPAYCPFGISTKKSCASCCQTKQ